MVWMVLSWPLAAAAETRVWRQMQAGPDLTAGVRARRIRETRERGVQVRDAAWQVVAGRRLVRRITPFLVAEAAISLVFNLRLLKARRRS